jgi:mannitol/fructose-specific phosphotransferase system IIA component (Ntr-type)
MITIHDTLMAEDVLLDLRAESPQEVISKTSALLRDDERVIDWSRFHSELLAHPPCRVDADVDFGICIPHVRTSAVSEMVMSAARLGSNLFFPDCSKPIRYLFCIGVPKELASDYLRIAGALMRIFKDSASEQELHTAATAAEFVAVLSRLERKL